MNDLSLEIAVLDALVEIKQDVVDYNNGICDNVVELIGDYHFTGAYKVISDVSINWEKFSGDIEFPVPAVDCDTPKSQFFASYNKWEGKYGALRYELLDFLIDELTKVVNKDEQKIACNIELFEGGFTNDQQ